MSENVIDLIHRLSYRSDTSGINDATQALNKQLQQLQLQTNQLQRLQRIFDATSANETAKRQRLLALMERQRQGIDTTTAATQRQLLTDRRLQASMEREIGIIGTLQTRLNILRAARTRATSEGDIRDYDRQISQVERRMQRLNGQGGIRGQIAQGLGIGAGFGVAGLVGSGLSELKDFVADSIRLASEAEGVQRAFNALDKPDLLDNLRTATRGTVSDLELMKQAVQFNNFQLPLEKLTSVMEFARLRARDTGQEVDKIKDDITNGIARQSPRILDNLGISQVRIREEFKKTGDFAQAAFKIIDEEAAKSANQMGTFADKVDQAKANIANFKAGAGGFFTQLGSDVVDLLSGYRLIYDNKAYLAENAAKREAEIQQKAHDAMEAEYQGYLNRYKSATKEGKAAVLNEVEIFEGKIRQAEQQSMAQGQTNLVAYYQNVLSMFQRFRIEATKGPAVPKTLEQLNPEELGDRIKRNKELIGTYTTESLKDPANLAERDRLDAENTKLQALSDSITVKKVKTRIKSHTTEYNLEKDLAKRIIDLQYQKNAIILQGEADTTAKLRKETDARIKRDNEELDEQIENARKRKILTPKAKEQFDQIRADLKENAKLEFTSKSEELLRVAQSKKAGRAIDTFKFDLDFERSTSDILGVKSMYGTETLIKKERSIALAEENKRFEDLKEVYRKEGLDIEEIESEHLTRLQLIDLQFFQKNAQSHLSYLEVLKKQVDEFAAQEISGINAASATEAEGLRSQRNNGGISKVGYKRLRELAELRRQIKVAQAEVEKAEINSKNAQETQAKLEEELKDPKVTKTRKPVVQKELDKAKQEANDAQVAITQARDGLDETNKSLLDAGKQHLIQGIDIYQQLSTSAVDAYNQITAAAQQANEREINIRQQRVSDAQRLAERGNVDALRTEEERLTKAQAMQEEYARRQQAINSGLTLSNSLVAVAKAGAEGGPFAFATIAATVSALIAGFALIKGLNVGFSEGGYTGDGGKYEPAGTVHKGEVVFSQRDANAFGGWRRLEEFRKGLHNSDAWKQMDAMRMNFQPPIVPMLPQATLNEYVSRKELNTISKKLDGVVDAINNIHFTSKQSMDMRGLKNEFDTQKRRDQIKRNS